MDNLIKKCKELKIVPQVFFDIGSYNGADAMKFKACYPTCSITVFEPHMGMSQHILKKGLDLITYVIADYDGTCQFKAVDLDADQNHGTSTIFETKRKHTEVKTRCRKIETLINKREVKVPDVVKLDVEGASYEALAGFGEYLKKIDVLHVEVEEKEIWKGQKLRRDVEKMLKKTHKLVDSFEVGDQSDLIFISKTFLSEKSKK